jgi:pimeloyl-ACP methyl ester carboxylesterase
LFASLKRTTVGEVASTPATVLHQAVAESADVLSAVEPLQQATAASSVAGSDKAADAVGTAMRVLSEALAKHEEKQLKPRKRKQQPSQATDDAAAAAANPPTVSSAAAASSSVVPSEASAFKRAKLEHASSEAAATAAAAVAPPTAASGSQSGVSASAPLLGASATAFSSMPAPAALVRQLSAVRTLSAAELAAPPDELGRCQGMAYALFRPAVTAIGAAPLGGVLVLPGAGSRKESQFNFARACRAAGLTALVPDLRGHGASDGPMDGRVLDDLAALAALLPAEAPLALRGSSMGGYLALVAANRLRAAAMVAICPAPAEGIRMGLAERGTFPSLRADGPSLNAFLVKHDDLLAAQSIACPLLLLHAEGDRSVPVSHSRALISRIRSPGSRLLTCPGGSHTSIQLDRDMDAAQVRWIREVLLDQARNKGAETATGAAAAAAVTPARVNSASQHSPPSGGGGGGGGATGSQVQVSGSSPITPFVAPEFAAAAVAPVHALSQKAPIAQEPAVPAAMDTDAPAFVAPMKPMLIQPSIAAAATHAASPLAADVVLPDAMPAPPVPVSQASIPSAAAAAPASSSTSPAVPAPAAVMPLLPPAVAPAAAAASSEPLASATSMQVDADALFAEEAGEQGDADIMQLLSQEGSVGLQVQQLRSTLHAAMAAMFAATGGRSRPVTPSHNLAATAGAAPSAPVTAASVAAAVEVSTVVSELNLPQLREIQSYLQSMLAATSRQIRRRERERSNNSNSRHPSAPVAGAQTPKLTSASSPPAGR